MSRYLLDTTVLIDFSRGRQPAVAWIHAMIEAGDELGICAVNLAEFHSGLPRGSQSRIDAFLDALVFWDISPAAATAAGTDRYRFARQGRQLSTTDVLVAAVARQRQAILVSDNAENFPMEDIELLALRSDA